MNNCHYIGKTIGKIDDESVELRVCHPICGHKQRFTHYTNRWDLPKITQGSRPQSEVGELHVFLNPSNQRYAMIHLPWTDTNLRTPAKKNTNSANDGGTLQSMLNLTVRQDLCFLPVLWEHNLFWRICDGLKTVHLFVETSPLYVGYNPLRYLPLPFFTGWQDSKSTQIPFVWLFMNGTQSWDDRFI